MVLLIRIFLTRVSARSKCSLQRNLIVPIHNIRISSTIGKTAVKPKAFEPNLTFFKISDVALNLNIHHNVSKTTKNSSNSCANPHVQQFHTGRPNYNPLTKIPFLLFVRPLISLVGNILTRLWKRLDPDKKSRIKETIRKFKLLLPLFGILSLFGVYFYYQQNVEEVDILGVKRKRFMILRTSQLEALSSLAKEYILYESSTIPEDDMMYRRVNRVLERIVSANNDIEEVKDGEWKLYIVDSDDVNTVGLPDNSIFIFKGIVEMCSNDEQLATVLSQIIARSVLSQYADDFSRFNLITILLAIPFVFFSFFDFGFITACIISMIFKTLTVKPYNREMVMEADILGLKMAAKACFDIKEAKAFWNKMILHLNTQPPNLKRKMFEGIHYELSRIVDYDYIKVETELFDSHPSHESRGQNVTNNIAQIIDSSLVRHCSLTPVSDYIAQFMKLKEYIAVIKND